MKYYKDFTKYKGKIILNKETKVVKTGRNQIEILSPSKSYTLLEPDHRRQSQQMTTGFGHEDLSHYEYHTVSLDDWLVALDNVMKSL
jgi:hypothetical protein